jgi:hypothetical protein
VPLTGSFGPDVAVLEAAQVVGSAEEEFVVVGHILALAILLNDAAVRQQRQHLRLRFEHREILRAAKLIAVVILAAAKRAARHRRVKLDAIAARGVDDLVAGIAQ